MSRMTLLSLESLKVLKEEEIREIYLKNERVSSLFRDVLDWDKDVCTFYYFVQRSQGVRKMKNKIEKRKVTWLSFTPTASLCFNGPFSTQQQQQQREEHFLVLQQELHRQQHSSCCQLHSSLKSSCCCYCSCLSVSFPWDKKDKKKVCKRVKIKQNV